MKRGDWFLLIGQAFAVVAMLMSVWGTLYAVACIAFAIGWHLKAWAELRP